MKNSGTQEITNKIELLTYKVKVGLSESEETVSGIWDQNPPETPIFCLAKE